MPSWYSFLAAQLPRNPRVSEYSQVKYIFVWFPSDVFPFPVLSLSSSTASDLGTSLLSLPRPIQFETPLSRSSFLSTLDTQTVSLDLFV